MHLKAKVTAIYYGAADLSGCRLALAAAAGAWDAGAKVRVRRLEQLTPPAAARPKAEWVELLREAEDVPEMTAEDLTWADAVLFGTSIRDGTVRAQLARFIDAILPPWSGVAVAFGDDAPMAPRVDEPDGRVPMATAGAPTATELAAAYDEGRRAAEAILALKAGRSRLAAVA